MNYLAHAHLVGSSAQLVVGAVLADALARSPHSGLTPEIIQGMEHHRRVDRFADRHPAVRSAVKRFGAHRHYAAAVVDIWFDHLLARDWERYARTPLDRFVADVYHILTASWSRLPARAQLVSAAMIRQDWLGSYRSIEGVGVAMARLARRTRRPWLLVGAAEMDGRYAELERAFRSFYPELAARVGGRALPWP